jgi:hypothetical protein
MPTNEILPFDGTDTNILTQDEYSSDTQRTNGMVAGIARSKLFNKAHKQSSLMSAALAQFIADNQSNDITDTLTPATIAGYLDAAITASVPGGGATSADIQHGVMNTAVAGGTADAITAAFTPAITTLTTFTRVWVRAGSANTTTTPTLTIDATAAKTIVKGNNLPLVAGDIAGAGHWLEFDYDSTLDKVVLLNPALGATTSLVNSFPTATPATSDYIGGSDVSDSNLSKRFLVSDILAAGLAGSFQNVIVYTTTGGNTWTKPAGLKRIEVFGVSGGGGGGGATNAATMGAGGRGGGYFYKKIEATSLGATETATVGTAGSAGSSGGGAGGAGGASSFGAHCSATGGAGGSGNTSIPLVAAGGVATGGDININGEAPVNSNSNSVASMLSFGGSSLFGSGGRRCAIEGAGTSGLGYGAGGSGGITTVGQATAGAAGTQGIIFVKEYF